MSLKAICLVILFSGSWLPPVTTQDDLIFVTDIGGDGAIWYGSLENSTFNLEKINVPVSDPVGIDYDAKTKRIYWTELNPGSILRAFIDGSGVETLVPSNSFPASVRPDDMVIDPRPNKGFMYWFNGDGPGSIIEMSKLDGSSRATVVPQTYGLAYIYGLIFDPYDEYLYWVDVNRGVIEKVKADGTGNVTLLVGTNLSGPSGIDIDFSEQRLYFCDGNLRKVESTDLNGGNRILHYEDATGQGGTLFGLGIYGNDVYWADTAWTTLFRLDKYNALEPETVEIGPGKELIVPAIIHVHQVNSEDNRCKPCCSAGTTSTVLRVEPSTGTMLGGDILRISGACSPQTNVICRFDQSVVVNGRLDNSDVLCATPTLFKIGRIPLEISFDGGLTYDFQAIFTMVSVEQFQRNPKVQRMGAEWSSNEIAFTINWDTSIFAGLVTDVAIAIYEYTESNVPELSPIVTVGSSIQYSSGAYTFFKMGVVSGRVGIIKVYEDNQGVTVPALWSDVHSLQWLQSRDDCSSWALADKNNGGRAFHKARPACPCFLQQALADFGRYSPHPDCNMDNAGDPNNCVREYTNAVHCVRATQPSIDDNGEATGQECCYDGDDDIISLIYGSFNGNNFNDGGGFAHRSHHAGVFPYGDVGRVPYLSHFLNDLEPRLQCCVFETPVLNCYRYKNERPSQTICTLYSPPPRGVGGGDPHILTLDGSSYTFNGKGEYVMLLTDFVTAENFLLQARTDTLPNSDFAVTVFVAFAAQYGTSDIVHVEISRSGLLDVWVKYQQEQQWERLDLEESAWWNLQGVSLYARDIEENGVLVLFDNGVSLQLQTTTGENRVMSVIFLGPDAFNGHTKGLLGTWNGNPNDDFLASSGTTLPSDASTEDIHSGFGQTWQIEDSDSLFYYRPLFGPDNYRDETFVPVFTPPTNPNVVPDEVTEACNGNEWCIFDFQATGDMEVAMASKDSYEEQQAIIEASMNVVICSSLDAPDNGDISITRTSVGGVATYSCHEGYMLMGMEQRVCQGNGRWFGSTPTCSVMPIIGSSSYSLDKSVYTVLENEKSVEITIRRSGDTQVAGSVRLSTLADTATSSTDFYLLIKHVEFQVGIAEVRQHISIRNDDIREELESFEIQLDEAVNSDIGMPDMATVFIEDDEVEHFFREIAYNVFENSISVRLTVQKVGYLGRTTVNFVTLDGSAKSSEDYTYQQGVVTFEPDKVTAYIEIFIRNDNTYEDSEQFSVLLQSNLPNQIGARDSAVVNIENDDDLCFVPCENGGVCTDIDTCTCSSSAFYGRYCEKDSCVPPCENEGKCTAFSTCDCVEGYQGNRCEIPICIPPCENGGTCTAPDTCSCISSYTGSTCTETVCSPPCLNRGVCNEFHACTCPFEFTGNQCEMPATNDCLVPNLCGGEEYQCIETMESYRCGCANGYYTAGEQCLLASRVIVGQISVLELNRMAIIYKNAFMFPGSREFLMLEEIFVRVLSDIFRFALTGFLEVKIREINMGSIRVEYEVLLSEHTLSGAQDVLDAMQRNTSPRGIVAGTDIKLDPFYTTIIEELCPANVCEENMICRPDPVNSANVCLCPDGSSGDQCLDTDNKNVDADEDEFSVVTIICMGIVFIVLMVAVPVGIFFCYRLRRSRQLNTLGSNRDGLLYGRPQNQLPSVYWATGNSRVYTLPPTSRSNWNGHPWTLSPNSSSNWSENPWGNYI